MSNPDPQDDQGVAEATDEDVLGADQVDDIDEDVVREDFPPERPVGLDTEAGVYDDEVDERPPPPDQPVTGLLDDDDDPAEEVAVLGDTERSPSAEEAAVHLVDDDS